MQSFIDVFRFLWPALAAGIVGGYLIAWLKSADRRHPPRIKVVLVWAAPIYLVSLLASGILPSMDKQDFTGLGFVLALVFIFNSLPIIGALHLIAALRGTSRWLFAGLGAGYLAAYVAMRLHFR